MSFSRIQPGGFAVGSKVTSSQFNQLDQDHANALDKVNGDSLIGVVTINGLGQISSQVSGGISADFAGAIRSTIPHAIRSTTVGGISLGGGATDEVVYETARTKVVTVPITTIGTLPANVTQAALGGFAFGGTAGFLIFGSGSLGNVIALALPWHQGATLTNVRVFLKVKGPHGTNPPGIQPQLVVQRYNPATGTTDVLGTASAAAGSGAAYDAMTFWDVPCAANNVIDRTTYVYNASLSDEQGSNYVAGNAYTALQLTFSSIPNMQFS